MKEQEKIMGSSGLLVREVIDAMPHMVFVVDPDIQIMEVNKAAARFLAIGRNNILKQRGGEVLHCINAVRSGKCGASVECATCLIRKSVGMSYSGKKAFRQKIKMNRVVDGKTEEFFALVTTAPIEFGDGKLVVMVIEDIKDLVRMGKLIPICAKCKKIRDDEEFWTDLENYLKDELDMDFTHGLCPSCVEGYMQEIREMQERDKKKAGDKDKGQKQS